MLPDLRSLLRPRVTRPRFLVVAPSYTHRSAGVRVLYRLCHHLNREGYPTAMLPMSGQHLADLPPWQVFRLEGPTGDAVVIYPEVVSGNPYGAERVVRLVMNDPGLLGGECRYDEREVVFAYDPQKLDVINRALQRPIGPERVLWVSVVDPSIIYPDPTVVKDLDCSFVHKGLHLSRRFPLDPELGVQPLELLTPSAESLGHVLRRTRTLYSYDHYSNVLREAAICGCNVRTIDDEGTWHDPEHCSCPLNSPWGFDFRRTYAARFHDSSVVHRMVSQLPPAWSIPAPSLLWRIRLSLQRLKRRLGTYVR